MKLVSKINAKLLELDKTHTLFVITLIIAIASFMLSFLIEQFLFVLVFLIFFSFYMAALNGRETKRLLEKIIKMQNEEID